VLEGRHPGDGQRERRSLGPLPNGIMRKPPLHSLLYILAPLYICVVVPLAAFAAGGGAYIAAFVAGRLNTVGCVFASPHLLHRKLLFFMPAAATIMRSSICARLSSPPKPLSLSSTPLPCTSLGGLGVPSSILSW